MPIRTKVGDIVTDIRIDSECYYRNELLQVWGTVEGQSRLLYISDLSGDNKDEVRDVVKATIKRR